MSGPAPIAKSDEFDDYRHKYRQSTAKSGSDIRPTTSEYDRALQEDPDQLRDMEEGGRVPSLNQLSTQKKCIAFGGTTLFILIFGIILMVDSIHTIEEGNVGIYFVQGALDEEYTHPGVHWSVPFVTTIEEITIRPQTETLDSISTVTRDGIQNTFHSIQVLSNVDVQHLIPLIKKFGLSFRQALIYDRVAEELRTFCANHTIDEVYNTMFLDIVGEVKQNVEKSISRLGMDGIKILNVVIPKPDIPRDIAANYKAVKVQWTEQLVATQQQKTEKIKKETESIKALLDAEREKDVLEIELQKDILKKEGEKRMNELENEIIKEREENNAEVAAFKKQKEAEANKALYSENYIKLELAKELAKNTKFYFSGENSPLGGLLTKILDK